jgi:stress-induced morphogen
VSIGCAQEGGDVVLLAGIKPARDDLAARGFDGRDERRELLGVAATGKNRESFRREFLRDRGADEIAGVDDSRGGVSLAQCCSPVPSAQCSTALTLPGGRPILPSGAGRTICGAARRAFGASGAMPMHAGEIERLIKSRIPDAEVTIRDLAGDGDHYAATVIAESFRGKSRVQQHQLVYEALQDQMGGALHALALQTGVPQR